MASIGIHSKIVRFTLLVEGLETFEREDMRDSGLSPRPGDGLQRQRGAMY